MSTGKKKKNIEKHEPKAVRPPTLTEKKTYGDVLIKDFMKLFLSYSLNNIDYARFTLHTLIGQMLKNVYFRVGARKIDIRTHMLLIQPSGSGKGAGFGIACDFFEELGLIVHKLTEASDAGLVGTIDRYDNYRQEYIINEGLLKDADLVAMEEASTLFDYQSEFSKKNLTYIQIACNPSLDSSSHIEKKLGRGDPIKLHPECSFLLLTYMPDKLMEALVKRGMLQRFVTIIRDIGLEERKHIINLMFDNLNIKSEKSYDELHDSILDRLKIIQKVYSAGNKTIQVDITDDAKENMRAISLEFVDMIQDAAFTARQKLEEFVHRLAELIIRISIHHALLRLSRTPNGRCLVEVEDTTYAKLYLRPIWKRLIAWIEIALIPDPQERARFHHRINTSIDVYYKILQDAKYVKKDVWVRRRTLIEMLAPRLGDISTTAADQAFSDLEKPETERDPKAWFEWRKYGSVKYVKLLKELR